MYPYSHDPRIRRFLAGLLLLPTLLVAKDPRSVVDLHEDWRTCLVSQEQDTGWLPVGPDVDDTAWTTVSVPHNWDSYEGYSQAKHGNLHGTAWYRTAFSLDPSAASRQVFLFFEGVGSYARVFVNGTLAGEHAGGLTTFTLDITSLVRFTGGNILAVEARHPSGIRDLPWVCGGCELAMGFSEGPQPFGIFRPVCLVTTDSLRVDPFGVHAWNDIAVTEESASLCIRTDISNHGQQRRDFELVTSLVTRKGIVAARASSRATLGHGARTTIEQTTPVIKNPILWSPDNPYLYTLVTELIESGRVIDRVETAYGIRSIFWPDPEGPPDQPFRINGKPFFINGIADYEHLLGQNHAFTSEQVEARFKQFKSAGFNAFRDAHHPHNLRFNQHWDQEGILWWTQFGAHIWFDTDVFRENYKRLLRDWVRERRNSPSLVLYGLQNESKLPRDFAEECAAIIRELDPTASSQRLITTCNGGVGTDWDIPQNWSGTYGGNPDAYSQELRRQRLVGEYGAWRSLGLHSEGGFVADGILSEDRMTALMETKVRQAERVRDQVAGHFAWPLTTHQNPGRNVGSSRQQAGDGIRRLDRIGPANNKGLFTTWGEPLDVYYMYRSNYADPEAEPMAYIVSHTWPDRWTHPGKKSGLIVYSNCEEVELYNGFQGRSLGIRKRGAKGTHFQWDDVDVTTNVLYAEARMTGKTVATDLVQLHHLPQDPGLPVFDAFPQPLTMPRPGYQYIYRVNAGGPDYLDKNGNLWSADRVYENGNAWGSRSWAERFPNLDPMFGSRRLIHDPVRNTDEDPLFQSFRYGREALEYVFTVPDGTYLVDLYFIEPWYGTGGGLDCTGWRLFDVAINGETCITDLDLWKEAGRATAICKSVQATSLNGQLVVSFPRVRANQAVISAISIAVEGRNPVIPNTDKQLVTDLWIHPEAGDARFQHRKWLDTGYPRLSDCEDTLSFVSWDLRDADWIQTPNSVRLLDVDTVLSFTLTKDADVFIVHDSRITPKPEWLSEWAPTAFSVKTCQHGDNSLDVLSRRFNGGDTVRLGPNGEAPGDPEMYSVMIRRRYPPPPARIIDNFTVFGSHHPDGWQTLGNFRTGQEIFSDGGPVIGNFSSRLSDCDWIRPPRSDADNPDIECRLTTREYTEIYVALDPRIDQLPGWLDSWTPSDFSISTARPESLDYTLLRKRFAPGETIVLGPNGSATNGQPVSMYSAIIRIVRADVRYEAEALSPYTPFYSNSIPAHSGTGYVDLARIEAAPFDWIIEVGVGDRYGLNFNYNSSAASAVTLSILVIAPDGQVMCEDTVAFPPTSADQWKTVGIRTCDSINAGTYTIRMRGSDLKHLRLDSLVVE